MLQKSFEIRIDLPKTIMASVSGCEILQVDGLKLVAREGIRSEANAFDLYGKQDIYPGIPP